MKNSIYQQRTEPTKWELWGIEKYFLDAFQLEGFIYSDKTMHLDIDKNYFGVYKINSGDDLFITLFNDDSENRSFMLNTSNDTFNEIDENFNFIQTITDLKTL